MKLASTVFVASAFVFLVAGCILVSGCVRQGAAQASPSPVQQVRASPTPISSDPVAACIALCTDEAVRECGGGRLRDCAPWSNGPCVSDAAPGRMPADWVCDVAHSPRLPADDDPANQCQEYLKGSARHFVEVTPDCKLIQVV